VLLPLEIETFALLRAAVPAVALPEPVLALARAAVLARPLPAPVLARPLRIPARLAAKPTVILGAASTAAPVTKCNTDKLDRGRAIGGSGVG
jgi:hypothetical protein